MWGKKVFKKQQNWIFVIFILILLFFFQGECRLITESYECLSDDSVDTFLSISVSSNPPADDGCKGGPSKY